MKIKLFGLGDITANLAKTLVYIIFKHINSSGGLLMYIKYTGSPIATYSVYVVLNRL